ncbi:hypothetical protein MBLNU459_g5639t1 [Dothideomycetes sp. NU459]
MSKIAEEKGKKRKGATEPVVTAKKVKTTVGQGEKAKPKSALKKAVAASDSHAASTKASKPARKRAEDFLGTEAETSVVETAVETAPTKAKKAPKSPSATSKVEVSAASKISKAKGKAEKSPKQPAVEESAVVAVAEEQNDDEEDVDDQTAALLAGFESSEDENDPEDDGVTMDKVPSIPDEKQLRKQLKAAENDDENTPGVVYVGRIPHGFYEHQMKAYFAQFGEITHLRLSRNKLTGRSKHYAFIEFGSAAVADIVAKTMDKYLLFGHILQVRRVPAEQVHEKLWKGEGRRFKVMPRNKIEGGQLKKGKTRENWEKNIERETRSRSKKVDKLKEMGYEFEMPSLRAVKDVPVKESLEGEGEGAGLLDGPEVAAILDKPSAESKGEATGGVVTEKAGIKRNNSKGDGKKAKKAKVAA